MRVTFVVGLLLIQFAPAIEAQSRPHFHHLAATPETVAWGYYSAAAKPVLRVQSGDTVEVETLITNSPQGLERAGLPPNEVQQSLRDITAKVTDKGPGGHILTGPIYIEGAEPGDVLEVRILGISFPIAYAYNGCSGFLPENCGQPRHTQIIPLDTARMIATVDSTIQIPMHPFFGSIGDAPPASMGRVNSAPPGIHAGNMDNKELVAGSTLYLPVWAPGALFEIGDGHVGQGNGEVDITALETSLVGTLQFIVHKGTNQKYPRAETPTHYISMGFHPDLYEATRIAVLQMIDFLVSEKHLSRDDAYMLTSVAGDVDITELVDGSVGVHVMLPKSIFAK